MEYKLIFQSEAASKLQLLKEQNPKKHKKVKKTLGLLQTNPRHQGLKTHKYDEFKGPNKEQVFEAYVENDTSGAYRVFWCYKAPEKNQIDVVPTIIIISIIPHP
ncbi:hypothetical protein PCC7805_04365 (plasmid) [Planktothrix agardhii]|uniref:Uncharacterized protein n=1 Tax=Planktothrix agardhii TaxID=1160 RepID=A0A1J1JPX6_PLAAG|nr:hypothetical protein [Planktothrix agardhii]MBG0747595.1 hypothetical protein [Planktothrix agardhii KL2]MCF3578633.1 hypothetical protein [Planktothrix agardhii 1812]MCF3583435.1 hypothetical protein [Planktothrix agardhii 1811]MCF3627493.1 hypothetical protein [Planktothrix agardhii 1801]CAD5983325.1 hypothetical protein PCC7805_04365 [Planktothrix agardhii]